MQNIIIYNTIFVIIVYIIYLYYNIHMNMYIIIIIIQIYFLFSFNSLLIFLYYIYLFYLCLLLVNPFYLHVQPYTLDIVITRKVDNKPKNINVFIVKKNIHVNMSL